MKPTRMSFLLVLVTVLLSGCASPPLGEQDYLDRLEKVEPGMSKSDFQQIFPESTPRKAKHYAKETVEVLEVAYKCYAFFPTGRGHRNFWTGMEGRLEWFYFHNGKLLQYGDPGDWPADEDLLIKEEAK